jgi:DNA-directed RNA polymerase specialized sigma24 family protein
VLQSAFTRAVPKVGPSTVLTETTGFAWIYRIVTDVVSDEWTRATRQRRDVRHDVQLPEGSSFSFFLAASGTGPVSAALRHEITEAVPIVLSLLKADYREVLLMRGVDGLRFHEIAAVLEISEENAAKRYDRASKAFMKIWRQHFPDWSSV